MGKRVLALIWLMAAATGCRPAAEQPLPTRRSVASLPTPATVALRDLPPTYTPLSGGTAVSSPTPSAIAALFPSPTVAPFPSFTPLPAAAVTRAVTLPFYTDPPQVAPCDAGVLFRSRFPSDYGGPWRYYAAYLPPCYGRDGRVYPVLYLFHGSIQTDSHWADLGLAELLDAGIGDGRYPPFIVIMPYNGNLGNISSGGPHSIEGVTVDALIPHIDASYCTWQEGAGRSIGGISRGGYWALMIAFRHPDLFTAVAGHSSHLRYETDKAEYNPLSTYAGADLSRMRIWLDWGQKDFLYAGQAQLDRSLSDAGVPHETHVNPGGHNEAYWLTYLPHYLDWHAAEWPAAREAYPRCER